MRESLILEGVRLNGTQPQALLVGADRPGRRSGDPASRDIRHAAEGSRAKHVGGGISSINRGLLTVVHGRGHARRSSRAPVEVRSHERSVGECFQLVSLSAFTCVTFLLHNLPPSFKYEATAEYAMLL